MSNRNNANTKPVPETIAKLVPNQSKLVEALVKQYRTFSKASSENILKLAKTIYVVETELNNRYREEFYRLVALEPGSSTVRKLKVIGEKSTRFEPYLDKLPNTWTTIYALASMENHQFQLIVDAQVLGPFVTMKAIQEVIAKPNATAKSEFRVSVDLSKVGEMSKRREFARKLKELADEYHVTLSAAPNHNEDLTSLIEDIEAHEIKQAA